MADVKEKGAPAPETTAVPSGVRCTSSVLDTEATAKDAAGDEAGGMLGMSSAKALASFSILEATD